MSLDYYIGRKSLSFIIAVIITTTLSGQSKEDTIQSFADKIIIKANIDTQTDVYALETDNITTLKIRPNQRYQTYLSLDYEFIGVSIGFAPKFIGANNDDELKGSSSFSDLQFRFFLGNWVQQLQYKKIKGYYIENTGDFLQEWSEGTDPYLTIPNLTNTLYGLSTGYVVNPKFSYRNVLYQTEWQKKSAGSFIPTLFYNLQKYSYSIENTASLEDNFNIRLAASYYYTFVIHQHWFISPHLSPSLGIRFVNLETTTGSVTEKEKETLVTRSIESGIQLGYGSKRWIFGGRFNFNTSWVNESKTTVVENDQLYALFYVGYRFDAPKFISNLMQQLKKFF